MLDPKKLEFDVLQSENFVEESYPGAGDGKGWRLEKNGNFQIGSSRGIAGEVITPYGSLRISKEMIEQASITPCLLGQLDLPIHQVHGERLVWEETNREPEGRELNPGRVTDLETVIQINLPDVIMDFDDRQALCELLKRTAHDYLYEAAVRSKADASLAARIGAMDVSDNSEWGKTTAAVGVGLDLGKEYLYVKQPGGPVEIGDLQKCCGRDTFTEQFLNREVRTDLKPEVVCALSMAAPITTNGKPPLNILPEEVDDCK